MKKAVVLDGYAENPGDISWEPLEKICDVTVYDRTPTDLIIERIGNAEIVITNKTPLDKAILEACPSIKYITLLATGYDVVDVTTAAEMGISVSNVPAYGTATVSQFAIGLLLEICHHIGEHSQSVFNGDWTASNDWCYWNHPLIELSGKTLGIIGLGRIGQSTAQIACSFGMEVLAFDSVVTKSPVDNVKMVSLDDLYHKSDVIILHCPLTDDTYQIINSESISKMKDEVIIINNARGSLIDEKALSKALQDGSVAAAAVDVVSAEPIKEDNPLLSAPNCIITPHISWATKEARQRIMDTTVENVKKYMEGLPVNIINF